MSGETEITICGNLVDDPELRFTPSGAAVAKFRIASTPRTFDRQSNEWKDAESLFLTCNVWRQPAENVAETLRRGMRVIVQGQLKQRSYETSAGEKRTVFEIEVTDCGPSLRGQVAEVKRANRQQPQNAPQQARQNGPGRSDDPWSSSPASGAPGPSQGGWGAPANQGFSEEPPF